MAHHSWDRRRALGHELDVTSLSLFDLSHHFPLPFSRADVLSVIFPIPGPFIHPLVSLALLRARRHAVSSSRTSPPFFQIYPFFPRLPTVSSIPFHPTPRARPRIESCRGTEL